MVVLMMVLSYCYCFLWVFNIELVLCFGVYYGIEVFYVFGNFDVCFGYEEEDFVLLEWMICYWMIFVSSVCLDLVGVMMWF